MVGISEIDEGLDSTEVKKLLTSDRPPDKCIFKNDFSYFSTKTYVVGAQKNRLNETRAFFHHFGTMTHTPGIGNFSAKMPKIGIFFRSFGFIVQS